MKNKGQTGEAAIVGLISIVAFLLIGSVIIDGIHSVGEATLGSTTYANTQLGTAYNNTVTNAGSGFNLASVAPIVLAAVLVLSILMLLARRK